MDIPNLRLAAESSIQGRIERRLIAGESLNAHKVADEYGCHWTNLSVAMDALKKQGLTFRRNHRGNRQHYFSLERPMPAKTSITLDFSQALEGHVHDLEERVSRIEDTLLVLAAAISRDRVDVP